MSSLDCSRVLPVNVSNMPWQIVVSADSSRASLLLEVAGTQAGITCLVNQDGQYYMNLRVSRGPNDASLDLRFMGSSSQNSFDEKSFNGLEFLYKENPAFNLDDVEQRLRDHWIICLAERVVEVMLCTGFSDRCRASIEGRQNMTSKEREHKAGANHDPSRKHQPEQGDAEPSTT